MDSEKGNRVFARGAQCAPPWFLEPKKSLVWIGLREVGDNVTVFSCSYYKCSCICQLSVVIDLLLR